MGKIRIPRFDTKYKDSYLSTFIQFLYFTYYFSLDIFCEHSGENKSRFITFAFTCMEIKYVGNREM